MALARVVTFEDIDSNRIATLKSEIEDGEKPEGLPATEMMILHDPEANRALAIVFFDNEDDYRTGDEFLERDGHVGHAGYADLRDEARGRRAGEGLERHLGCGADAADVARDDVEGVLPRAPLDVGFEAVPA